MKFNTTRFGELEVDEEKIIEFPYGVLGLPEAKRYILLDHYQEAPFKWLQALDDPNLAFVVMDPLVFKQDFHMDIERMELKDLEIERETDLCVMVIITIPQDQPEKMTANLLGPIVVNIRNRKAKQLVMQDSTLFPCQYPLIQKDVSTLTSH